MEQTDAVVVGGGPAGLSAALWIARYRRSVVLLDSGEYRARSVEQSHGYLGRDPQQPMDLLDAGRAELLAYPTARVAASRAEQVRRTSGGFEVAGLLARRLVLACGVRDVLPDVPGLSEHYGSSVFHCPSCDGYEARDRDVVVLGWDRHLVGFAESLLNWARSVTVVTHAHRFNGDVADREALARQGIEVVEERAAALMGQRGDLRGIRLGSGQELPAALVFFSIAHEPRTDLADQLGCHLTPDGYVEVNECGETSVSGVFAAGDLVPGLQLVQVAAATGAVAGVALAQSLQEQR